MCHRSCETGSSSSLALTLCKIYLRCHKSPPDRSRYKIFQLCAALWILTWRWGQWAVLANAWCRCVLSGFGSPSNKLSTMGVVLKDCASAINWVTWVWKWTRRLFFLFISSLLVSLCCLFLKGLVGTILFICISWRHCQWFSWCFHKYACIQDCQKRKEKKDAMEQIELGMFVFSVLFNAQLFLEVALSLCIPFFPLPSALYGGTYLCVCV